MWKMNNYPLPNRELLAIIGHTDYGQVITGMIQYILVQYEKSNMETNIFDFNLLMIIKH